MSALKIRQALEVALKAIDPAFPTAYENAKFDPVVNVAYQRVNLMTAAPENPTQGSGFHREVGYLQVTLNYPLQKGASDAATQAEVIRTAFPRGASFSSGGVTVMIERTAEICPGAVDGDRWAVPIKIRWYANVFS